MLQRALDSVTKQDYTNLEIIVVDDGSNDNTEQVVKRDNDKRIKYYRKKNSGPADSRNYGLKKAKGKYICFLDDDDTIKPDKINKQVKFLKLNSRCVFCYTNAYFYLHNKQFLYINHVPENTYLSLLLKKNYLICPSVMVRKQALVGIKLFQKKYEPVEDFELWLRLAKKYPFGYLNHPSYSYNVHGANLTKNIHKVIYNNSRIRYSHLITYSQPIQKRLQCDFKFLTYYYHAIQNYYEGNSSSSRKTFLKLIKERPLFIKSYIFYLQSFFPKNIILNIFYKLYLILQKERVSIV
ncbi:hypothetical protein A3A76_02540 [Candidatus Woesebacteria bacterium RIFCSPLOWO2_01_FULL_39_23]|uniref:Glycosyltransferase 2-like domain-containing protein n=1 Tax=Candidatus Woesebacteria bacterium RIFCSPHIGHO2_01_FULL_40_22 TaxID=1802499 RepID=A0A1F7YJ23_9BACT|nr:MAG: hypothetical protein A2141_01490 [Candidatus Woesebacteria bacterium RBG_16_40_11]OGM27354.1 MAG: hypothetical protein A2628_00945 [Candidatus Woesebacteria bacterium RIFCSPHIGHO2_01_FULL_40_22]OGM36949.1 MAG: hypothetical protein A3E41_05745 [Candidatus Woesebacteria bacterium RIFCSPHIGHO2_12_FULL_38_9]OGM62526.1 MAG: hypothetical protein A3A76_02540 [Candidatus Woesebacteria bacterium RIFCSPLOWO2_01_FULL_39_23]